MVRFDMPKGIRNNVLHFVLGILVAMAIVPSLAYAQTEFVHNDEVVITLPPDIQTEDCEESLALKAGGACLKIEHNGMKGVLFYRQNEGYALMSQKALEKHILDSVSALSDIPNVHVRNSRILPSKTLLGMIDIVRNDDAVAEVTELAHPPISQTALLIPLPNKLGQLFIYLPNDAPEAQTWCQAWIEAAPQYIQILVAPPPTVEATANSHDAPPEGTLALMPKALLIGGAAALFIILILHRLAARKRREDS